MWAVGALELVHLRSNLVLLHFSTVSKAWDRHIHSFPSQLDRFNALTQVLRQLVLGHQVVLHVLLDISHLLALSIQLEVPPVIDPDSFVDRLVSRHLWRVPVGHLGIIDLELAIVVALLPDHLGQLSFLEQGLLRFALLVKRNVLLS